MENEKTSNMNTFIRNDQYNFIKFQMRNLVRGHATVNDMNVLNALKSSSLDKVLNLFPHISNDQKALLSKMIEIEENIEAKHFLSELMPYVMPFQSVTDKSVKKLFPKVKKLKTPAFENMDFKNYSYLGWNDAGSRRKYVIAEYSGKLIGIQGTIRNSNQKGICKICNGLEEVGLFMSRVKSGKETYTERGNYICYDSEKCNQTLITLNNLNDFITQLKK